MGQDFIHLDWDTNLFGFGVAKITLTNPDKAQLSQTLKILRKNNYRLAYWHIPVENMNPHILLSNKVVIWPMRK